MGKVLQTTSVIISSSSLKILGEKIEPLQFPESSLEKLEIVDVDGLKQLIVGYIAKFLAKKKVATLFLAQDVLFQQSIPLTDLDDVKKQSESFFKEIPLDEENLAKKTLTNDKEVYLLGTSRDLFSLVKEAFEQGGWTIDAILPLSLFFGFSKDSEITKKDIEEIYENEELYQSANFLSDAFDDMSDEEGDGDGKKSHGIKNLLFIGIAVLILILAGVLLNPFKQGALLGKPAPTPTPAPTATPMPTPTSIPKDKGVLKVSVLNGSGIVGQAAQVKNALVGLGFTSSDITTDNADSNQTGTTVVFSSNVGQSDRDAVVAALKKTFDSVNPSDASGTPDNDIVITTGK